MTNSKNRSPMGADPFHKPADAPLGWVGSAASQPVPVQANQSVLAPIQHDSKHRTMISFPNDEFSAYAVLLAQVQAHHHVRITFNDYLRLAALTLRPKLEDLAKADKPITRAELYRALKNKP